MTHAATRREQTLFRNALSYFTAPALQRRTMEYAISSEVRAQDAPGIIAGLMHRPWSTSDTWQQLKTHWNSLHKSMGMFQALPDVVQSTQSFCDLESRNDVDAFFREHRVRWRRTDTGAGARGDRALRHGETRARRAISGVSFGERALR